MLILLNLLIVAITSVVIMYACNSFQDGSRQIGKGFPPGVRGATINAIGSSMPEFFTTLFLLFLYHDVDGYSGGIATCAGSAVFNAVIIPGLCIITVLFLGVIIASQKQKVEYISIQKHTMSRDGVFFIASEIVLIAFLSQTIMFWWMGAILVALYGFYLGYLIMEIKRHPVSQVNSEKEEEREEHSLFYNLRTLNFRELLFKGKEITQARAWFLLLLSTAFIAASCHFLAKACVDLAILLGVPTYFTCVIIAAAATSVPDTVLSILDARKGYYDDAVANAFGSNIFDINWCLGFPLFLYGLIYGEVHLSGSPAGTAAVQELRILLLIITFITMGIFLMGRKMGRVKAILLFSLYIIFIIYVFGRGFEWSWLAGIGNTLRLALPAFS